MDRWLCVAGLPRVCPFGDALFLFAVGIAIKKALFSIPPIAFETGLHHPPAFSLNAVLHTSMKAMFSSKFCQMILSYIFLN